MLKLYFAIIFIICELFLVSCAQSSDQIEVSETNLEYLHSFIDTNRIAIILFDQEGNWPFDNSYKPAILSASEIQKVDSLITLCITDYNGNLANDTKQYRAIDFGKREYKLQYMPVVNNKGEKEVWVNSFCNSWNRDWKKEVVQVKDGGNCYFNLKINLATNQFFDLTVNGEA